jgi:hypothetical protein
MFRKLDLYLLPGVKPLRQTGLNKVIMYVVTGFKPGFVVGIVDLRGHRLYFQV